MADQKVVNFKVAAPNFVFVILEPSRSYFAKGENVRVNIKIKNNGVVAGEPDCKYYNDETGAYIGDMYFGSVPAGGTAEKRDNPLAAALMPDHDWSIKFTIKP